MKHYTAEIEITLGDDDEPFIIGVITYKKHRGSFSYHAASDLDFYGYTEMEWELLNPDKTPAVEREKQLTQHQKEWIEDRIHEELAYSYDGEDYYEDR